MKGLEILKKLMAIGLGGLGPGVAVPKDYVLVPYVMGMRRGDDAGRLIVICCWGVKSLVFGYGIDGVWG